MNKEITKKGSILAYSLIILSIMLAVGLALSKSVVLEKKNASDNEFSSQAFQVADSGFQFALKAINAKRAAGESEDAIVSAFANCDVSTADGTIPGLAGSTYKLTFYKDTSCTMPVVVASGDCLNSGTAKIKDIQCVKSLGLYKNTVRVVSVAVATDCPATMVDADTPSNTYNTVRVGSQCWMKENLRSKKALTEGTGYFCPPNATNTGKDCASASTLGYLYRWGVATNNTSVLVGRGPKGICPAGWHMPSQEEFTDLERTVCTSGTCDTDFPDGTATTGWLGTTNEGVELKDASGFNGGIFAGYYTSGGNWKDRGTRSIFWVATEDGSNTLNAWTRELQDTETRSKRSNTLAKTSALSVRCLKD